MMGLSIDLQSKPTKEALLLRILNNTSFLIMTERKVLDTLLQ
jgi:hypothetical protein